MCGLKQWHLWNTHNHRTVTPHVGVWIETVLSLRILSITNVTPHVGVWIETVAVGQSCHSGIVTPHVGVWIETIFKFIIATVYTSHTSCRCVD